MQNYLSSFWANVVVGLFVVVCFFGGEGDRVSNSPSKLTFQILKTATTCCAGVHA